MNNICDNCLTIIFSYLKFSNFLMYIRPISKKFNNFGKISSKTHLVFQNIYDILDGKVNKKKIKRKLNKQIKKELATLNINIYQISNEFKYIPKNVLSKISSLSTAIIKKNDGTKNLDLIKKIKPPIKKLTLIDACFNEINLDKYICDFILTFSMLESLHIHSCIGGNFLKLLSASNIKLKNISITGKALNIPNYCNLYGNDLKYLIMMPLESISLSSCIFNESFDVMKNFNINELSLYYCKCDEWDENYMYSNVKSFNFTLNDCNQIKLLKQFNPKKLILNGGLHIEKLDDSDLIPNIKHMQLEELFISKKTFKNINMFVGMPLKFLTIESDDLQDEDLKCLCKFPLISIKLSAPKLKGSFFEYLRPITTLKYLKLFRIYNNIMGRYLHFLNKTYVKDLTIGFEITPNDISGINLKQFDYVHIFSSKNIVKIDKFKGKW